MIFVRHPLAGCRRGASATAVSIVGASRGAATLRRFVLRLLCLVGFAVAGLAAEPTLEMAYFATNNLPRIQYSGPYTYPYFKLRAKATPVGGGQQYQMAEANNNGDFVLNAEIPPPGDYTVDLYVAWYSNPACTIADYMGRSAGTTSTPITVYAALPSVSISSTSFPSNSLPTLNANGVLPAKYKLRARDATGQQRGLDSYYNDNQPLASIPGYGTYDLYLYCLQTDDSRGGVTIAGPGVHVPVKIAYPDGSGTGLLGQYYPNIGASGDAAFARIDPTVNFFWGSGTPDSRVGPDNFSVVWTGKVQPRYSETYTFSVSSDDGVRLLVNDSLLINKWQSQGTTEWSGSISLTAGQPYSIRLEYLEGVGGANVQLFWQSASQGRDIIPSSQLYPNSDAQTFASGGVYYIRNLDYPSGTNVTVSRTSQNERIEAGPTVTVMSGATVNYVSPVSVRLVPGFRANNGSAFTARIAPAATAPVAPTNLIAVAGNGQVSLAWSAADGATTYDIKRSTTNGGPYTTAVATVSTTNYVNIGLTNGTTYYYVVVARNNFGPSGDSNQASATPVAPPPGANVALADGDGDGFYQAAENNLGRNPLVSDNPLDASGLPPSWSDVTAVDASRTEAVGVTSGQLTVDKNGAATYSIPLWVSPGTAGMEPKLTLSYSSQGGAGIAGFGWSLGGISTISRGPKSRVLDGVVHAMDFTDDDQYYLDGQRLILVNGTHGYSGAEYRTEIESFTRVVCFGRAGNGPARFRAWTKAGLVVEYGNSTAIAGVADNGSAFRPDNGAEVQTWAVSRIWDTVGNYMQFRYATNVGGDDYDQRITEIGYTGKEGGAAPYARVVFEYETRLDKRSGYVAGRRVASNQRLTVIRSEVGGVTAREYLLRYNTTPASARPYNNRSLLTEFEQRGAADANGARQSMPVLKFEFENPSSGWVGTSAFAPPAALAQEDAPGRGTGFVDLNGDGRPDFVRYHRWNNGTERDAWLNTASGWVVADGSSGVPDWRLPVGSADNYNCVLAWDGFADFGTRFIDFDGDGRMDVLHALRRGADPVPYSVAYRNTGSGWQEVPAWRLTSGYLGAEGDFDGSSRIMDINGDGRPDIVWNYRVQGSSPGNQNRGALLNTGSGWTTSTSFAPPFPINADTFFVDVNGDGLPDQVVHWYGSNTTVIGVALNSPTGWLAPASTPVSFAGADMIDGKRARLGSLGVYLPPLVLTVKSNYSDHEPIGAEFVDLNGDGLVDVIAANDYESANPRKAYLNTGRGWVEAASFQAPAGVSFRGTAPGKPHESTGAAFVDVNGDGLVDIVVSRENTWTTAGVYLGTGSGWTAKITDTADFNLPRFVARQDGSKPAAVDFVDFDADGSVDQVWHLANGPVTGASRNTARAADRLLRVTTGLGISSAFTYQPLTTPGVYTKLDDLGGIRASEQSKVANLTAPMYVVTAVDNDDGVGGQHRLTYRYIGLRSHVDRGSLGFQTLVTTDTKVSLSAPTAQIETVTSFEQNYPFTGLPTESFTRVVGSSAYLSDTVTRYPADPMTLTGPNGGLTRFIFAAETTERAWDLNGDEVKNVNTKYFTPGLGDESGYDTFGNALHIEVDSGEGYKKVTASAYDYTITTADESVPGAAGSAKWFLGRLSGTTVTSTGPGVAGHTTVGSTNPVYVPTSIVRSSSFTYYPDSGLLASETVEPGEAADSPLRLVTTYQYDQWGNKTLVTTTGLGLGGTNGVVGSRTTSANYDAVPGEQPYGGRFQRWTENSLNHRETYTHDSLFGVVKKLVGPNGLASEWQYDGFARKVQEDLPDTTGVTTSNPNATGLSRTTMRYGWSADWGGRPAGAVYFIETRKSGAPPAVAFYDAMGRLVGGFTLGGYNRVADTGDRPAGYRIVGTLTRYDGLGRPFRTSLPYFLGQTPKLASGITSYDVLGRPLTVISSADGVGTGSTPALAAFANDNDLSTPGIAYTTTTSVYAGLTTTVTAQRIRGADSSVGVSAATDSISTSSTKNKQGWVMATVRNTAAAAGANDRAETAFVYDPLGQICITKVRDTSAYLETIQLGYDRRGRKVSMYDASMGFWTYAYNSGGELTSQTDPKSRTSTLVYDTLGRQTSRTEVAMSSTGSVTGTISTTWTYDTANRVNAAGASVGLWVGKLTQVQRTGDRGRDYTESYTYTAAGRVSDVSRSISGLGAASVARKTTQRYDPYGRPTITIYPGLGVQAGYAIETVYDDFGLPIQVRDARNVGGLALWTNFRNDLPQGSIYWQADEHDIWGLAAATLGNGTTEYRGRSTATGRLLSLYTGNFSAAGAQPDVQSLYYTYDSFGNVISRRDVVPSPARLESFAYDALDRITQHTTHTNGSPLYSAGTVSTTYDPLGNLRSKSDNGGTYSYGNSSYPYRVTAAGGRSYGYDELGGITTDGSRQFYYAASGQMQRIVSGSTEAEFWFGAGDERVIQQKTSGGFRTATLYLGAQVEMTYPVNTDGTFGAATEIRYYVTTPLGRTAVRTETPGSFKIETRWFHQDALGSVTAVTNEWGAVEHRFAYDAWGKQAKLALITSDSAAPGPTAAHAPNRGYTDHEMLEDFGLIHMNGRVYDPVLGRFVSADPNVDGSDDSQGYNRYSYVGNNPLNHTDPSGYFKVGDALKMAAIIVAGVITAGAALCAWAALTGVSFVGGFAGAIGSIGAAASWSGGWGIVAGIGMGFGSSFAGSLLNGASLGDAFKAGVIGGLVGGVAAGLSGELVNGSHPWANGKFGSSGWLRKSMAEGVIQGLREEATHGEFRHGFYAGAFVSAFGEKLQSGSSSDSIQMVSAMTVGGTASVIGGGKFSNGATSSFFTYLFGVAAEQRDDQPRSIRFVGEREKYDEAIAYLRGSPDMDRIIKRLDAIGRLTIIDDRGGPDANYYDPIKNELHWNPTTSIRFPDGNVMTPALVLGHELTHASANPFLQIVRLLIPLGKYTNLEEWRTIALHERPAAVMFGQPLRYWHQVPPGVSFPMADRTIPVRP